MASPLITGALRGVIPTILLLALSGVMDEGWAKAGQRKKRLRSKHSDSQSFEAEADESVAEQVNDPTSFLRETRLDVGVEHGSGSDHTTLEWTPALALPLSERLRFEAGIPLLVNGPNDRNDLEPGDVYGSVAYIFASTPTANYFTDFRIDLPTGNEPRGAGLSVTQWHAALGSVIYAFNEQSFLIIPTLEYRRSIFGNADAPKISSLIGNLGVVYLWSEDSYLRGEWTVSFDAARGWRDAGLLNLEVGKVFFERYSVSLGYEFDLWGDAEIRNAAQMSVGYLF